MSTRNFEPEHRIDMYQARCTNCGYVETEYGDFGGMSDVFDCIEQLEDSWFARYIRLPLPRTDVPRAVQLEIDILLCPDCQECEVCGSKTAYRGDDEDHLICKKHEDHDFSGATP